MGRPITSGECVQIGVVKRLGLRRASCAVALCLCAQGCASDRGALLSAEVEAARRHADYVVREARAEVAALRSEIAAARLAAARQKAELEALHHQLAAFQQTRAVQQRALEAKEAELAAVRNERDQSLKTAVETHAAQAGVQARITELETTVTSLSAELAEMKKHRGQKPPASPGKPAADSDRASTVTPTAVVMTTFEGERLSQTGSQNRPSSIRVQPGDSLWAIARRYRLTVADLKETNELTGDLIRVGQRLIIPPMASNP
jgi:LysM repeat protein